MLKRDFLAADVEKLIAKAKRKPTAATKAKAKAKAESNAKSKAKSKVTDKRRSSQFIDEGKAMPRGNGRSEVQVEVSSTNGAEEIGNPVMENDIEVEPIV